MAKSPADKALKRWRRFVDEHAQLAEDGASEAVLAEHRRQRTRLDPSLFALVYLSKHLVDAISGKVGMADVHVAWCKTASAWASPPTEPMADRRAEVAPREMGKSTWWFLALPLWAAAHRHVGFAAAFADTDTQAQTHLATFKGELDGNALIRLDYPDLVAPKTRGRGTVEADRVSLYHARSGFVFSASGMDSSNLGLKVGSQRPDLIILDDIEPHEGRYSAELANKRLGTLLDVIFPLNIYAHVIIAGTVTMQDSIVHQVVRWQRRERDDSNAWVGEQRIEARHTPAIIVADNGQRASVWPAKWPLSFLESIEHTRTYAKNYANDPLGASGDYWEIEHVELARTIGIVPGITKRIVCLDPAVTTKRTSDYTGIAVIGWAPPPIDAPNGPGRCLDVLDTLERHNAGGVLVETNQGGDLWRSILWGLPVKVKTVHQSEAKEVRAARSLDHYERNRVGHAPDVTIGTKSYSLKDYEGQLVSFPRGPHDDMVDATDSGILFFLDRGRRRGAKVGGEVVGYAG